MTWRAATFGLVAALCGAPALAAPPDDPGSEADPRPFEARPLSELPMVQPLRWGDPTPLTELARLRSDPLAFAAFRERLREHHRAVRAFYVPRAPFDPSVAQEYHGVAFRAVRGEAVSWITAGPLVFGADRVEILDRRGRWRPVEVEAACAEEEIATLRGVPTDEGPGGPPSMGLPPTATRRTAKGDAPPGLPILDEERIIAPMPVMALSNLEGALVSLDAGTIEQREVAPLSFAWRTDLVLSPGTPLVDPLGRVLLMRLHRGTNRYDVSPLRAVDCPAPDEPAAGEDGTSDGAGGTAPTGR